MENNTDLRNEIDYEIPYVLDDGTKGIKKVHIAFVSQGIYQDYNKYVEELIELKTIGDRLAVISSNMGYAVAQDSVVYKEGETILSRKKTIKEIRDEIAALSEESERLSSRVNEITSHLDEKRFNIVRKIIIKNSIEDKDMLSLDWWMNCVDRVVFMDFIKTACTKDDDKLASKKKVQSAMTIE